MKYEAKILGNDNGNQTYSSAFVPDSRPAGTPWVNISQTNAITEATTACSGCHLITEAEWMTIAQNALSVPSNWSGGAVGNGCIFRGNVGTDDACGYNGSDPEGGTGRNTKASLTLTNSEVIWDLAGNVSEWTSGTSTNKQPGVTAGGYAWREYPSVTNLGSLPAPSIFPAATGLTGASSWTSANGIGKIYSNAGETVLRGFLRGGDWNDGVAAGVLALNLGNAPSGPGTNTGFRVSW
jgi:formylglycine-generating enzyme required for sulfatase activity